MSKVFSESPGRGKWYSLDCYMFKLSTSAESGATQPKFQGIPSLVITYWVPADPCGGVAGSQVIFRMMPIELSGPKRQKFSCVKGGLM